MSVPLWKQLSCAVSLNNCWVPFFSFIVMGLMSEWKLSEVVPLPSYLAERKSFMLSLNWLAEKLLWIVVSKLLLTCRFSQTVCVIFFFLKGKLCYFFFFWKELTAVQHHSSRVAEEDQGFCQHLLSVSGQWTEVCGFFSSLHPATVVKSYLVLKRLPVGFAGVFDSLW